MSLFTTGKNYQDTVCSRRWSIFTTSITNRVCPQTHPKIENSLAESKEEQQDLLLKELHHFFFFGYITSDSSSN